MKSILVVLVVLVAALLAGCMAETPDSVRHSDEGRFQTLEAGETHARWQVQPFRQVGVLLDTRSSLIEARVDRGAWQPIEITWEEGEHKVGRLVLEGAATGLELRADRPWSFGTVQFFDDVEATELVATELPFEQAELSVSALAPASMVISRSQWGARNPSRVCGSWHDPYRISIHHTFLPADDGGDAAARMRQMQAYHIDNRGWCDIGYHFIVSQSGKIYQGRSNEQRTGAHTDDQNTGNIGISFIGDFDRQTVNATQFAAGAKILGWTATTYDVPFNRRSIRGHREHAGQSTACPGANLLSRLDELIAAAQRPGAVAPSSPAPVAEAPVAFEVNWRSDETDLYTRGSSLGTPDVFPGDWMRAEIVFKNTTAQPLRGVQIGFDMDHLVPTSYVIESDAPRFNGTSFSRNDADNNPSNPARTRLGQRGKLGIYALTPGETKRVTIDFHAGDYSIGAVEHGGLRAWVQHIDAYYGEQTAYDAEPSVNAFNGLLQDAVAVDVLSDKEWQFDGGESTQLEGWSGCSAVRAAVDTTSGSLTMRTGPAQCVESPAWTSIDAGDWDQVVLRMDVTGRHTAALYWAHGGEGFVARRAVTFEVSEDRETYVLDLGSQPTWRGEIARLRLVPSIGQGTSAAIDAVFVQSSDGRVASARESYQRANLVRLANDAPALPDGRADASGYVPVVDVTEPAGGCSTASSDPSAAVWLFGLVLAIRRRRRP